MTSAWDSMTERLGNYVFRIWTAAAVLALYGYGWIYTPDLLIWWKRTTTTVIEAGCGLLPYPWNDRVEATLGNFGLWVQITLAITAFRILTSLTLLIMRHGWRRYRRRPERSARLPADERREPSL